MFDEYTDEEFDEDEETQEIDFIRISTETTLARLMKTTQGEFWAPKAISRIEDKTIVLPDWFDIKYVKPNNPFA